MGYKTCLNQHNVTIKNDDSMARIYEIIYHFVVLPHFGTSGGQNLAKCDLVYQMCI